MILGTLQKLSSETIRTIEGLAIAATALLALAAQPAVAAEPDAAQSAGISTPNESGTVKPLYFDFFSDLFAPVSPTYKAHNGWWYESRPAFWFAGIDGTIKAGGRSATVNASFSDLFDKTNFGLSTNFDIGYDKLFLYFDGIYYNLGSDPETRNGVEIDTTLQMAILEPDLGYRFLDMPFGDANQVGPRLTVDALAGVRWTYFNLELNPSNGDTVSRERYWVDPIVGTRLHFAFNDHWAVMCKADIGGFGVGSDLVWNVTGQVEYQLFDRIALMAGWRILDYDYKPSNVEIDLQFSGPFIGFVTRW